MAFRPKPIPLIATSLVAFAVAAWGLGQSGKQPHGAKPQKAPPKVTVPAPATPLTVNDLAARPDTHLGPVSLVGVVATTTDKKGFLLIDTREYKACGLSCLTEAGTKKIPVRWSGAAPKVKDTVRVDGTLAKEKKGFALTAAKVARQ